MGTTTTGHQPPDLSGSRFTSPDRRLLGKAMGTTTTGHQLPDLSPVAEVASLTDGPIGAGGSGHQLPDQHAGGLETSPNSFDHENPVPMCHHEALVNLAGEVYRLARELKRRVNADEMLPVLATLSALGPLHEMLTQQYATQLMVESTTVAAPPPTYEIPGISPAGYL